MAVFLAFGAAGAAAQDAAALRRLEQVVADARAAKATISAVAGRVDAAAPFFASDASRPLIPASNEKVLTCGAAVFALGPDAEIKTEFIAQGPVEDGVLKGALRARGEGDPTFGAADFGESLEALHVVAARLRERGVRRIAGDVLADDAAFDRVFTGPEWPKAAPTERWMAESAALSLDEGVVRVVVKPGRRAGEPAEVALVPDVGYVRLVNRLTTAPKKDARCAFERGVEPFEIVAKGSVRAGGPTTTYEVAVHDPPLLFAAALRRALADAGIVVDGRPRRAEEGERTGGTTLVELRTPLARIFPRLLKESQNHRAEMVFRHLGYRAAGLGSLENASAATLKALASAGVPTEGLIVADGSGLSRRNRCTAAALYGTLAAMARRPDGATLREMFAEPGEEGTLERRLPDLKDRLFAKTGTLDGASSLSGYVLTEGGAWTAFAVIVNGPAGASLRRFADAFAEAVAKS